MAFRLEPLRALLENWACDERLEHIFIQSGGEYTRGGQAPGRWVNDCQCEGRGGARRGGAEEGRRTRKAPAAARAQAFLWRASSRPDGAAAL